MKHYEHKKKYKGIIKNIDRQGRAGTIEVRNYPDINFSFDKKPKKKLKLGYKVEFLVLMKGENFVAIDVKPINAMYVPRETIANLKPILKQQSNFLLGLNKYVFFDNELQRKFSINLDETFFSLSEINSILKLQDSAISKLSLSATKNFQLSNTWRMVIGLGGVSVYETSMTLHHIYGIPYIPGQALKGIARSWYIKNNIPDNFNLRQEKADEKLEKMLIEENKLFRDLFGNPKVGKNKEQSGKIIFFDAFPAEPPVISEDVMTPHYSEYYGDTENTKPPADYYNPIPIKFLTLEKTAFRFHIGVKANVKKEDAERFINEAEKLLKEALINMGVGAKTAVGYGYFE